MYPEKMRIGLYGISGVGKSTLLKEFNKYSNSTVIKDGSEIINELTEGGLSQFKTFSYTDKSHIRSLATKRLLQLFGGNKKHFIVAGHFCFPENKHYEIAWTEADSEFYQVIFYLHKSAEVIKQQQSLDPLRSRVFTIEEIENWQNFEFQNLCALCKEKNIRIEKLDGNLPLIELEKKIIQLISDETITSVAKKIINDQIKNVMLLDCDGTLSHQDVLDFATENEPGKSEVTKIFQTYPQYCFDAYYEVSLLFSQFDMSKMNNSAQKNLIIHSEIKKRVQTAKLNGSYIIFVSSGFPTLWQKSCNLADKVLGGASFNTYGCILSNESKANLALHLTRNGVIVSSFGNGLADLGMLKNSHYGTFIYKDQLKLSHKKIIDTLKNVALLELKESHIA